MAMELVRGGLPSPLHRLVDDYLISCRARGLSRRTDEQYSSVLQSVFLPWCEDNGITAVGELDRRTLDRFTSWLLTKPSPRGGLLSKFTVHSYVRPVRIMLGWAAREGEDVKAKPQLPRRPTPARDVLSRDEIDRMEKSLTFERDRIIVRLFADCGLRLEELSQLATTDILRSGRQAHLRVLGKRSRVRDVPLPPGLLRRLDRLSEARPMERRTDQLFIKLRRGLDGTFEPLGAHGCYQVVKEAASRAGIDKRVHPHVLRHSWMTEMLRNGMNPIQLSIIAGASVDVISQHYTHLTKDDAYEAMLRVLTSGS